MFDIGWMEVLVILVVALFAIGPDRMPEAARFIGRTVRMIRRWTGDIRQVWDELEHQDDTPHDKR